MPTLAAAEFLFGLLPCCMFAVPALFVLAAMGFWIWAIVEVATKEPAQDPNRMLWLLVVIFAGFIGALIYLLARRPERIRTYGR